MTTKTVFKKPEIPSPWGAWMLAKASLDAADAVFAECNRRDEIFAAGDRSIKCTFMSITAAFLYFRSVELALKAAILERALAPSEAIPTRKLGHDITKLIDCATTSGGSSSSPFTLADLGIDEEGKKFLEHYSDDYANKWFEYDFGTWPPRLDTCKRIATAIIEAIRPIARTHPPVNLDE